MTPPPTIRQDRPSFAMMPTEYARTAELSDKAFRLWVVLATYADDDDKAWPGWDRLATDVGCHRATIGRAQAELVERGMLDVDSGAVEGVPNVYQLRWPESHQCDGGVAPTRRGGVAPTRHKLEPLELDTTTRTDATDPVVEAWSFDEFWNAYPPRGGIRRGKAKTKELWRRLSSGDRAGVMAAVRNYAASDDATRGFAKDPERFLRGRWWEDWESATTTSGKPEGGPALFAGGRVRA